MKEITKYPIEKLTNKHSKLWQNVKNGLLSEIEFKHSVDRDTYSILGKDYAIDWVKDGTGYQIIVVISESSTINFVIYNVS
jgi:hypothetical protein